MRVGLTYNLKNTKENPADEFCAEWDDPETIDAILKALSREYEVIPVIADLNAYQKLIFSRPDIVFNVAEGKNGPNREAHIPAILEFLNIPYTGSDPFSLSACLDKARTKEILSYHGIAVPRFQIVKELKDLEWKNPFPALVKPLWEGSSIGVHNSSWVENQKDLSDRSRFILENYHQPALIEEALTGREFTVALIGNGKTLESLPIVEVRLDVLPKGAHPIYSYEAKWVWDVPENPLQIFECPASLNDELRVKIESVAKAAFLALGCRDWCRIDIRLDASGEPYVLELNPLPGILPDPRQNSCFPKSARAAGLSYEDMILKVLRVAMKRYGLLQKEGLVSSLGGSL